MTRRRAVILLLAPFGGAAAGAALGVHHAWSSERRLRKDWG